MEKLSPDKVFQLAVEQMEVNRANVPGFQVERHSEGDNERLEVLIDGPEKIQADIANRIDEVQDIVPISGTGYYLANQLKALLDKLSTANNTRIAHVSGDKDANGKVRESFWIVLYDNDKGETCFLAPYTSPIFETPLGKGMIDHSSNFSGKVRAHDLGNGANRFISKYGSVPGRSPQVSFYQDRNGDYRIDMVMGTSERVVKSLEVFLPDETTMNAVIIKGFQTLVESSNDQHRVVTYRARRDDGENSKTTFDIQAYNGTVTDDSILNLALARLKGTEIDYKVV